MISIFGKGWYTVFCWAGFLVTFGAGLVIFIAPETIGSLVLLPTPAPGHSLYFIRLLGLVLIPMGMCYMLAAMDPDASRSLLFITTSEKALAVLYSIAAFLGGMVNRQIFGVIIGDGLLALIGIYAVINFSRIVETIDSGAGEQNDEEESAT